MCCQKTFLGLFCDVKVPKAIKDKLNKMLVPCLSRRSKLPSLIKYLEKPESWDRSGFVGIVCNLVNKAAGSFVFLLSNFLDFAINKSCA